MTDTMYRLLERFQQLDERLRLMRGRAEADLREIVRLERRRLRIRARLGELFSHPRVVTLK